MFTDRKEALVIKASKPYLDNTEALYLKLSGQL